MTSIGKDEGRDERPLESKVEAEPSKVGKCSRRKLVEKLIQ